MVGSGLEWTWQRPNSLLAKESLWKLKAMAQKALSASGDFIRMLLNWGLWQAGGLSVG